MATFNQVENDHNTEIFKFNSNCPQQEDDSNNSSTPTVSVDESNEQPATATVSTIFSSKSKSSLSKKSTSPRTLLKNSNSEEVGSKKPPKPPRHFPLAPIQSEPKSASRNSKNSIKNETRTRIRTIEELLDSSSDLDLPLIEPPPIAIAASTPTSSEHSSLSPTAPEIMSTNKKIFSDNNGASNEFCSTNLPNECIASTSSPKKTTDTINYIEVRSNSISPTPTTATSTTGLSGVITVNHYERLIEELKCPGCAYPMRAPIKLCATGHSICQNCTTILMMCPLCKEPFIDLRSLTLEALCSKAHFRCSNAAAGCTVRLQIDLLNWHEKQCIWKPMKCFMGRVWGDCSWSGREAHWKDHLESLHTDKVFRSNEADLVWNMNGKILPLAGYYVFEVYDEMFNFYLVHDRDRILFTMTVTSTVRDRKLNFAYEVEMFHKDNEALVITQRFPVHSEYDKDILLDGTCVCVALTDLSRFMGQEKILYFRVRLNEIKSSRRNKSFKRTFRKHPIDFQQTNIEGANLKSVPAGVIVTRQSDDNLLNVDKLKTTDEDDDEESSSEEDSEFEAYIEKKWGTPQMNFNRKYLRNNNSKESSSSSGSSNLSAIDDGRVSSSQRQVCEAGCSTRNKMRNVTSSLRKSLRSLRTDIIDLKKPFSKSPEKKETLIKK